MGGSEREKRRERRDGIEVQRKRVYVKPAASAAKSDIGSTSNVPDKCIV